MIPHCTIGRILKHNNNGQYGFKLTGLDLPDAQHLKPKIAAFLEKEGIIITRRDGVFER